MYILIKLSGNDYYDKLFYLFPITNVQCLGKTGIISSYEVVE